MAAYTASLIGLCDLPVMSQIWEEELEMETLTGLLSEVGLETAACVCY